MLALLRGVNLGKRRLAMADLRRIVEGLGHADVETYLQSGNVVFTPKPRSPRDLAGSLEGAISESTGFDVPVVVRTGAQLREIVAGNPYPADDPTRVLVGFLGEKLKLDALGLGDLGVYLPDELTLAAADIYVSVPRGQARSKLVQALTAPKLGTTLTLRNWRTVTALAELTRS
jgi:uncharacterized protein (DUF1697 family)